MASSLVKPKPYPVPAACPKCGSEKGFRGPEYRGTLNYITRRELKAMAVDGQIPLAAAVKGFDVIHERLWFACQTCGWPLELPCLDTKEAVT
jgi:hypothetical protein